MSLLAKEKYRRLRTLLGEYDRIAVAFSGGVDSTLLLFTACLELGGDRVVAYHADSCLTSSRETAACRKLFDDSPPLNCLLKNIEIHPMIWSEFLQNSDERCYFCKKRLYTTFLSEMEKDNLSLLVDGTNVDDLKKHRPGFRAINELGVLTPLVEVGLSKDEIRFLANDIGIPNGMKPSNSCLATRIPSGEPITEELLQLIERAENFLADKGIEGCRVRPENGGAVIEPRTNDPSTIASPELCSEIIYYFKALGFDRVLLNLQTTSFS